MSIPLLPCPHLRWMAADLQLTHDGFSVRVRVTLRLAVYCQSVRLGDKHLETHYQHFFQLNPWVIVLRWHPLWLEDGSFVYNCSWSSSAQSFSGPSPAGIMTYFTVSNSRLSNLEGQVPVFISPKNSVVILPGTGFPFRCLLRLAGLRCRYSNPPPPPQFLCVVCVSFAAIHVYWAVT
jgi:hypothetical protein